jgi:hypothetical protein
MHEMTLMAIRLDRLKLLEHIAMQFEPVRPATV